MTLPITSRRTFLVAAAASALGGCLVQPHRHLPPLSSATSVEIRAADRGISTPDQSLKLVSTVTDAREIAALLRFFNSRLDGWYVPVVGGPIPAVRAQYLENGKFVASLGAGPNFFSRGIEDTRHATPAELREFLGLLHLDEKALRAYASPR